MVLILHLPLTLFQVLCTTSKSNYRTWLLVSRLDSAASNGMASEPLTLFPGTQWTKRKMNRFLNYISPLRSPSSQFPLTSRAVLLRSWEVSFRWLDGERKKWRRHLRARRPSWMGSIRKTVPTRRPTGLGLVWSRQRPYLPSQVSYTKSYEDDMTDKRHGLSTPPLSPSPWLLTIRSNSLRIVRLTLDRLPIHTLPFRRLTVVTLTSHSIPLKYAIIK